MVSGMGKLVSKESGTLKNQKYGHNFVLVDSMKVMKRKTISAFDKSIHR